MASWLDKIKPSITRSTKGKQNKTAAVPEGLWKKCPKCEAVLYGPELESKLDVCPKCDHHLRIGARRRLEIFLDEGDYELYFASFENTPSGRMSFRGVLQAEMNVDGTVGNRVAVEAGSTISISTVVNGIL